MTSSPNRVFKLIWCRWRSAWVVVSERVSGGRARSASALTHSLVSMSLWAGAGLFGSSRAAPAPAQLPTQGRVSAGRASMASAASTLTVTQSSSRVAIDWGSFDIGAQATVHFVQPGRDSIALNRVVSSDPSQIYGHLDANGQVFLLNPSGVYFAPGAAVDVGSIVATTGGMSDAAFLAGGTTFARDGASGTVVNAGTIRSRLGGYIALLAPQVRNQGLLVAQAGTVAMAGGETVRLNFGPGSTLQSLTVTPGQLATLIDNRDAVRAPGGLVILSARAMNQLAGDVINSGRIEAVGATEQGGRILLEAGSGGRVDNAGLLSVASSGGRGGCVSLSGGSVELGGASRIDANGASGGGTVRVGGDWHGGDTMPQARSTVMQAGARIDAAATRAGNGGEVVLWSSLSGNGSTRAAGRIDAQGAGPGGLGGRIETSGGHVNLGRLSVDAGGAGGSGLWLIDPYDYTITATAAANIAAALDTGTSVTITTSADNVAQGATGVSAGNITLASPIDWSGSANLTLSATGNIAIEADVAASAQGASFTAQANGAIFTGNGIRIQTHNGSIVFWSNANGGNAGGIAFGDGNTFNSANGSLTQQGGGGSIVFGGGAVANAAGLPTGAAISSSSSGISAGSGNGSSSFTVESGGGDIVMCGASSANSGVSIADGYLIDAGGGNVTISGTSAGPSSGWSVGSALGFNSSLASSIKGGNVTLSGSSMNGGYALWVGDGWSGAVAPTVAASHNLFLAGNLGSGGGSSSVAAVYLPALNAASTAGDISITGSSTGGGAGTYIVSTLNATAASAIEIDGRSAGGGYGVYLPKANVAAATALTVNATSATGDAIHFVNGVELQAQSANLTLIGSSAGSGRYGIFDGGGNITAASGGVSLISTGNVQVASNLVAGGAADALLLKSSGDIVVASNVTLQTNNGAIVLWSNANGGSVGGIDLGDGDVVNTGNGSTSQTSGGGAITLGGGVASANGAPTGAAVSNSTSIWAIGLGSGSATAVATLDSAGGDIRIDGQSDETSGTALNAAVSINGNTQIHAFNGNITIIGNDTSGNSNGIQLGAYGGSTDAIEASGNISLTGSAVAGGVGILAVNQGGLIEACGAGSIALTGSASGGGDGIKLSQGNNVTVLAQYGDITLCGTTPCTTTHAVDIWNVLDAAGNITVNAGNSALIVYGAVGQLAGSQVPTSSANITLIGNISYNQGALIHSSTGNITLKFGVTYFHPPLIVGTNGSISLLPLTPGGFAQTPNFSAGQYNLDPTIANVGYVPEGLTIGDPASQSDVAWGSAINVNGPISIYGGNVSISAPIVSHGSGDIWLQGNARGPNSLLVSANITRTASSPSNITLRAAGRIVDSAAISSSNGAANITEWADAGNATGYGIGGTGNLSSHGGDIWIGGSSSANGHLLWHGLTVGDGPAEGASGGNTDPVVINGNIASGGGDVLVWAGNSSANASLDGITVSGSNLGIATGTGNLTLITDQVGGGRLNLQSFGTLDWTPDGGAFSGNASFAGIEGVGTHTGGSGDTNTFVTSANSAFSNVTLISDTNGTFGALTLGRYAGLSYANGSVDVMGDSSNLSFAPTATAANLTMDFNGALQLYGASVDFAPSQLAAYVWAPAASVIQASNGSVSLSSGAFESQGGSISLIATGSVVMSNGAYIANDLGGAPINVAVRTDSAGTDPAAVAGVANISTHGGNLWVGGASAGATPGTWHGMVVGDAGTTLSVGGNISTAGGDLLLWGAAGTALDANALANVSVGSGTAVLITDAVNNGTLILSAAGGTLDFESASGNFGGNMVLDGVSSGGVFVGCGTLAGVQIQGVDGSTTANASAPMRINVGAYAGTGLAGDTVYAFAQAGTITVQAPDLLLPGSLALHGSNVSFEGIVGTGQGLSVHATQSVAESGAGEVQGGIDLQGGNVSLSNVSNLITTLNASGVDSLQVIDGSSNASLRVNQVSASGAVKVVNLGAIELAGNITTGDASKVAAAPAIELASGYALAPGTTTGNVTVDSGARVTAGIGGVAVIYSGAVSGSSGLTSLVGSGSGRFRYDSNVSVANYNTSAAPLSAGLYAVYREQPTLDFVGQSRTVTYGSQVSLVSSSAQNGDTLAQIFGAGNEPVVDVSGSYSTAGFLSAGNHAFSVTGASSTLLGYAAPVYGNGTVVVNPATLTVGGTAVADKAYDATTVATFSNAGSLVGVFSGSNGADSVVLSASGNFTTKNAGSGIAVLMNDTISGADAGDYTLTQPTASGHITPRVLTLSDTQTYTGGANLTSVHIGNLVAGETLGYVNATAASSQVSDNGSNFIASITLFNQSGASSTSGGLISNYRLPSLNASTAPVTLDAAPLTVSANSTSKVYGQTRNFTGSEFSSSGLVNNETVTSVTLSSNGAAAGAAVTGSPYAITASDATGAGGFVASNYNIRYVGGQLTVTPAPLGISATGTYTGTTAVIPTHYTITGLLNGDTINSLASIAVNSPNVSSANRVDGIVVANGTALMGNYRLDASVDTALGSNATNTFVMAPAPLTVTPVNAAVFIGQSIPTTYNVSYHGFVNGQTAATAGLTLGAVTNSANNNSPAGNYSLNATGWSAPNYALRYVAGKFTVAPANELRIQTGTLAGTYGSAPILVPATVQYLEQNGSGSRLLVNLSLVSSSGNSYVYTDSRGGSVRFTLDTANSAYSGSGKLRAGSYQIGGSLNNVSGPDFNGSVVFAGSLDMAPLAVSAVFTNLSKVYDGTTAMPGLQVGAGPSVVIGDSVVLTGHGSYAQSHVGAGIGYSVAGLALSGADASNYVLAGSTTQSGRNGTIVPKAITLIPEAGSKTYDGHTAYTASGPELAHLGGELGVAGDTLSVANLSYGDPNVGSNKTLNLNAVTIVDGSGAKVNANYVITLGADHSSSITRLGSVTWVGGSTGNWFDPANWAGGAVPDLENVANVVIPSGTTVQFGNTSVAPAELGLVRINSLRGGKLLQTAGKLAVAAGGVVLDTLSQQGGSLASDGELVVGTYRQSGGATVSNTGIVVTGSYSQTGGNTSSSGNFSFGGLGQPGEFLQTGGKLSMGGSGVITAGANVTLNNLSSNGSLAIHSSMGWIVRTAGASISAQGAAIFSAPNGAIVLGHGNSFGAGQTISAGASSWVFVSAMLVPLDEPAVPLPGLRDGNGEPLQDVFSPGGEQVARGRDLPLLSLGDRRNRSDWDVQRIGGRARIVDRDAQVAPGVGTDTKSSHRKASKR